MVTNPVVPLTYGTLCERGSKLRAASRREVRTTLRETAKRLCLHSRDFHSPALLVTRRFRPN
ncbi:MAG: hypothetical protein RMY16_00640 [Nostoc sp. DedQUE12b]|uniref:hypothetical protein n=1 Tax=Nostoc sp. DedQUE12b TaxID=3075398 RepID=UPI002AD53741|nr:hypothetical protein [Nostoc sp. DedQUE12b]MDZ8084094.1 hypothetical protein [Nostoc sp. DedQUE12b]